MVLFKYLQYTLSLTEVILALTFAKIEFDVSMWQELAFSNDATAIHGKP